MKSSLKLCLIVGALCTSMVVSAKIKDNKKYGDWEGTCQESVCGLIQLAEDNDKNPVGRVFIRRIQDEKDPVSFITLPLGVNLRAGMAVAVDGKELGVIPYDFCDQGGCNAAFPLDDKTMNAMKKGKMLQIATFVGQEQVTIGFSLSGFTKGISEL